MPSPRKPVAVDAAAATPKPPPAPSEAIAVRPKRAAALAGVSVPTIERALRDGKLRSSRIGRCRLIRIADLDQWLVDHRVW